jgi:hypothetical protein
MWCAGPTGKYVPKSGVLEPASTKVVTKRGSTRFGPFDNNVAITMNFYLFDLAGFIGVLLIVVAYLLLQLDKLPSSSPRYSLLNAAGALLIMVSLIFAFNLSAFIVEAFWFLISMLGLWRSLIPRKHSQRSTRLNGNGHQ